MKEQLQIHKRLKNARDLMRVYEQKEELAETTEEKAEATAEIAKTLISIKKLEAELKDLGEIPQDWAQEINPKITDAIFFKKFFIFTGLIALLIIASKYSGLRLVHPYIWLIFSYCAGLSVALYFFMKKGLNTSSFPNYMMIATMIRLFLTLSIMMIYLVKVPDPERKLFAINFIILYFLYVGFEIKTLLSNLQQNSKKS